MLVSCSSCITRVQLCNLLEIWSSFNKLDWINGWMILSTRLKLSATQRAWFDFTVKFTLHHRIKLSTSTARAKHKNSSMRDTSKRFSIFARPFRPGDFLLLSFCDSLFVYSQFDDESHITDVNGEHNEKIIVKKVLRPRRLRRNSQIHCLFRWIVNFDLIQR